MQGTAMERALRSLDGLSVGDGFGESFFRDIVRLVQRQLPPAPWRWTDDTQMALSVVEVLGQVGHVDQDRLAAAFCRRYEPGRGYGAGAHHLMEELRTTPWRVASAALFDGRGSYGNGGAMRVAPLGAFYADKPLGLVAAEARRSAEVTHWNVEGQEGAVAVAVATASLIRAPEQTAAALFEAVLSELAPSLTRQGVERARHVEAGAWKTAYEALGTGNRISAQDTAPFCVWVVAHHRGDFAEALWQTATGLGDIDTTCAIVGGMLANIAEIPSEWLAAREALPALEIR